MISLKKNLCLFLAAALTVLPGCAGERPPELSRRLIIEAVGVDRTDAGFAVTVQTLDSIAVGTDEGTPESGVTKCYTFHGTTIGEAFSAVSAETGLTPLYSQARLLILGFETARDSLCEALDFFLRAQNARADIPVAVAEHTAAELVTADFGKNRVGADLLEDAIRSGEDNGAALGVPLYRFIDLALGETDAAYCPLLGVTENELSGDCLAACRGTVIFNGTNIGTVIKEDETLALRILTNQCSGAEIVVREGQDAFTLRITRESTRITAKKEAGNVRFRLQIDAKCDINEVCAKEFSQLSPDRVRAVADAASRLLTEQISRTLTRCCYENGCDVCRFRKRLRLRWPGLYRSLAARQKLSPADLPCDVVCRVQIRRTGKEVLREGQQ